MIEIGKVLVSDEIIEEQFVCDLHACKGGCCEDGDAGAPLEETELATIKDVYKSVLPYLTAEGKQAIAEQGHFVYHTEFGYVTPVINGGLCAYGLRDNDNIIKCGIEQAYNDGKISWKKPISCHLFPIRIKKTKSYELVNYEPRETLCSAACNLGKQLKVPVYAFLKEPITRKFGDEFFSILEQAATFKK